MNGEKVNEALSIRLGQGGSLWRIKERKKERTRNKLVGWTEEGTVRLERWSIKIQKTDTQCKNGLSPRLDKSVYYA